MNVKAAYTGTFDPITLGHAAMIERASVLFSEVVVAIASSSAKNPLFDLQERVALATESLAHLGNVSVRGFTGLTVNFAAEQGINVLVRGIRNVSDFDYEAQMAQMIRHLKPDLDTVILAPSPQFAHISSTLVREIAQLGGDIDDLVPESVMRAVKRRRQSS